MQYHRLAEADDLVRLVKAIRRRLPSVCQLGIFNRGIGSDRDFLQHRRPAHFFEGTRHTNDKADSSYAAFDITGESESCVAGILGREGVDVSTLDVDGDGVLDACDPNFALAA